MVMQDNLKFLVIEGYRQKGREELEAGGMSVASDLYKAMLQAVCPEATVDIVTPADPDGSLPAGVELNSYDGTAMTGSNLSVVDEDDPAVKRQVELQKEVFRVGVPSFGSCWALQVGVVAAGGSVRKNPKGREMGFARKITLTSEGLNHPLYQGKPKVFDAFASHEDEIDYAPQGSTVLSGNDHSEVQALEIKSENGVMWTIQYHPEYNLKEMAALIRCRTEKLIGMGFFADETAVNDYAQKLDEIHTNPERRDLAWALGIDADILSTERRFQEVANWIEHLVKPSRNK